MGCLSCTWTFTKLFLVCAVITFMPGIPPHTEFKEYTVARPRALDAELLARKSLDKAEHLFEGQITGPEAFAVYNGAVYTGIHGGFVVQIDEGELKPVVKFGQNCDDITEEHICGRPLGLKFDAAGNLYVVDAYYGVFKYNIQKAEKTLLVGVDEEIEGKPSKFMNDLAVAKDGTVYITVSSTTFPLYDGLYAIFAPGDGRIIKYDPKSKKTTVLADGLLFPNGIALSKNEDFLVFAESSGARVMRMDLKGNNKNSVSIFAEGLPGVPDNVRFDGQDGFLVSLVGPADESHPSLLITLGPFPNIRKFLARALYLLELPFIQINNIYPNYFTRRAIHSIGHLSITKPLIPDGVNIVRLDSMGEITDALVGRDGSVSHVSDMIVTGDHILLASPYNNFIGRVPRPNHPHHVTVKSVRFEPAEDESAARKAAEEAKASKAREEQAKKAAEAASKAKRDAETAAARKAAEEASRIKKEAESAAQKAAEQAKAKAAEEARKKMAAEAQARKAAEEARAKKAAEDAAKRAAEEAKAKRAAEEAAKRAAEEAKAKKLAEEAKQAKAKAAEELAKKKAAEELAKKASEESKPKKAAGNANKN